MGTFISQEETPTLYADKSPAPGQALRPGWSLDNVPTAENLNDLKDALLDTRAAIRGMPEYAASRAVSWATATAPYVLAHRGTGNVSAPENTLAALDYGAALGHALEFDVQATSDSVLVLAHDTTWSRMTAGAVGAAVSALTADATLRLDVSQGYRPDLFSPQRPPLFEDVLRRYGSKHLLCPEVKDEKDATATALAQLVVRYGLQDSVVVQSFNPTNLTAVRAVDSRIRVMLTGVTPPSIAGSVAGGHWGVFVSAASLTADYVTQAHAAGLKVLSWTPNKVRSIEAELDKGVDGYTTDDPSLASTVQAYTPRGVRTVGVPPNGGLVGGGYRPYASAGATWVPEVDLGYVTYDGMASVADGNYSHLFLPAIRLSAALATAQTIGLTLKYVRGPTSAVTTRYLGLKFCWNHDGDTDVAGGSTTPSGYYFILRQNGAFEINRVTNGAFTLIDSATWTAVATGTAVPFTVTVTATTIQVTRTDTGQTLTVTDATHPRTGFIAAFGSGVVPGLGNVTVTY